MSNNQNKSINRFLQLSEQLYTPKLQLEDYNTSDENALDILRILLDLSL